MTVKCLAQSPKVNISVRRQHRLTSSAVVSVSYKIDITLLMPCMCDLTAIVITFRVLFFVRTESVGERAESGAWRTETEA